GALRAFFVDAKANQTKRRKFALCAPPGRGAAYFALAYVSENQVSPLLRWEVHGSAKLSHLFFQNWRRVVRKIVEDWNKSVSRKPTARRRSLSKSHDLLLYRHGERIFGDRNIVPLFGESFEGEQIIA